MNKTEDMYQSCSIAALSRIAKKKVEKTQMFLLSKILLFPIVIPHGRACNH